MRHDAPVVDDGMDDPFVRPYMITAGRTVGAAGEIPIEAMVVAQLSAAGLGPDHAMVHELCSDLISVAEIAVHIGQPIGVARVLVADLTASGHLDQHDTAATEGTAIVRRLLNGISQY